MESQSQSLRDMLYELYADTELTLKNGVEIHKTLNENIKRSQVKS